MAFPGQKIKSLAQIHFRKSPAECQRCHQVFEGLWFEEIEDIVLLRGGDFLVEDLALKCPCCGRMFYWSIPGKKIAAIIATLERVLEIVRQNLG